MVRPLVPVSGLERDVGCAAYRTEGTQLHWCNRHRIWQLVRRKLREEPRHTAVHKTVHMFEQQDATAAVALANTGDLQRPHEHCI
jgi:hypothetical protein